uniref:DsbA family protein n=1 Tax=Herbidospora sakaeratensis TaxID=564415 RepID=UPI0009FFBDEA|nr:thioredoxin domain-containing protein [Herbidospora sakaeratensis]
MGSVRTKVAAMREKDRQAAARRRARLVSVGVVGLFAVVIAAFLVFDRTQTASADGSYVREDSHVLSKAADGKVTLVEFLDFECEACRAYFPVVEELRKKFEGRVTFVARYFPIPSHFNAERAARAVEAAAQQGRFEDMYKRMFETQQQWGEQRVPADPLFRTFAEELKLDLAAWDKAYADPATLERIRKDQADGEALGVSGTPTFFLNEKKIQPESAEAFEAALDAALAG